MFVYKFKKLCVCVHVYESFKTLELSGSFATLTFDFMTKQFVAVLL